MTAQARISFKYIFTYNTYNSVINPRTPDTRMHTDKLSIVVFVMVCLVAIGGIAIMLGSSDINIHSADLGQAYFRPDFKLTNVQAVQDGTPQLDITTIQLPLIDDTRDVKERRQAKEDVNITMDELWFGRYARQINQWDEVPLDLMREDGELTGFMLTMPRAPCEGGYRIKLLWIDSDGIFDWPGAGPQTHAPGLPVNLRSEFDGTIPGDNVQIIVIIYCGDEPELDLPLTFPDTDADTVQAFFEELDELKDDAHISSFTTESQ